MRKNKSTGLLGKRDSFKPFEYPWAYEAWLRHEQSHWTHNEVPMHEDVLDWRTKLSESEKSFLTNVFRFFTQTDIDISGAYTDNYIPLFKKPEIKMMLMGFAAREALHVAAYSHLIETLGMSENIYQEFLDFAEMKDKHDYIEQFKPSVELREIAKQIAVFSGFTEGMQLFSSFILLMNFPRHGKMKGMGQIVSWSQIDEAQHCEAMIKLFRQFVSENASIWDNDLKTEIYEIAKKMVELEDNFIDLCFSSGAIEDLTADQVKTYIRYITDRRLISLGLKGIFKIKKNPLPWVEEILNAPIHGNFFEQKATEYSKSATTGTWNDIWAR